MKRTKFIVVCSGLKVRCDKDELVKVYEAVSTGSTVLLRQGMFNPSFFVGIEEDVETMAKFREDRKYDIRDKKITEYPPYPDLFADLRQDIKQLTSGKTYKNLLP